MAEDNMGVPKHGSHNHIVVEFPNGLAVSIITDGYGSAAAPYEAYLTKSPDSVGTAVVEALGFQNDGIVGWLTPLQLGELLQRVGGARVTTVPRWEV